MVINHLLTGMILQVLVGNLLSEGSSQPSFIIIMGSFEKDQCNHSHMFPKNSRKFDDIYNI